MLGSNNLNNQTRPNFNMPGWQQRVKFLPRRFWNNIRENNRLVGLAGMLVIAIPFIGSFYAYRVQANPGATFWKLLLDPGTIIFALLFIAFLVLFLVQPLEGRPHRRRLHYPSYHHRSSKHD